MVFHMGVLPVLMGGGQAASTASSWDGGGLIGGGWSFTVAAHRSNHHLHNTQEFQRSDKGVVNAEVTAATLESPRLWSIRGLFDWKLSTTLT